MSRMVLPFPVILFAFGAFAVFLGLQWVVHNITSIVLAKDMAAVVCEPQALENKAGHIRLGLLCGSEEAETQSKAAIVAWANEKAPIKCTKESHWNSDDVTWDCVPEKSQ